LWGPKVQACFVSPSVTKKKSFITLTFVCQFDQLPRSNFSYISDYKPVRVPFTKSFLTCKKQLRLKITWYYFICTIITIKCLYILKYNSNYTWLFKLQVTKTLLDSIFTHYRVSQQTWLIMMLSWSQSLS
jgi:hypothetical protein